MDSGFEPSQFGKSRGGAVLFLASSAKAKRENVRRLLLENVADIQTETADESGQDRTVRLR